MKRSKEIQAKLDSLRVQVDDGDGAVNQDHFKAILDELDRLSAEIEEIKKGIGREQ